jgi:replicative DNA helicase
LELNELPDRTAEYKKAAAFCKTVKDKLVKSDIADELAVRWGKPLEEVKEYLSIDRQTVDEISSLASGVDDSFEAFKDYLTSGSTGLGFKSIDESLGGIKDTDVIGLGAYSGNGKSFIAAKIAAYRLVREKNNVLIFTMEMPKGQFMQTILQELFHMNKAKLLEYLETDEGADLYAQVKEKLGNRLRFVDDGDMNMDKIAKVTEALNQSGFRVDFVIVDHFQLLRGVSDFGVYESEAHKMKFFTNKYHCPLLMLTQLNDGALQTDSKKFRPPVNKDIKGPNSFISACDIMLLVWRPALVDSSMDSISREEAKNDTYFKISKSRREMDGPLLFKYKYNKEDYSLQEVPLSEVP